MGKDLKIGVEVIDSILLGTPRPQTKIEAAVSPKTLASIKELHEENTGKRKPGRPRKEAEEGEYFRTTIIAHKKNYEKLKVVAMKLGRPFKDVLNDALSAAVDTFEEKHGEITLRGEHANPFK